MNCARKEAAPPPDTSPSDTLNELAIRVQRLSPDRRDPERFHMDKSELVHDLRRLALRIGAGR